MQVSWLRHALNGLDFLLVHFNTTVLDNEAEELSGGESMGRRERYYDDDDERYDEMGERGGYGGGSDRGGYGERRGVRGTGRYSRYR